MNEPHKDSLRLVKLGDVAQHALADSYRELTQLVEDAASTSGSPEGLDRCVTVAAPSSLDAPRLEGFQRLPRSGTPRSKSRCMPCASACFACLC